MECPREIRASELFFFLLKKEPMVLRELVGFGPSILVEAVNACALVGVHMMAKEDSWRTDSGSSFSSSNSSENNVGNGALFVIGLHGSGDATAPLPTRLGGGKGSLELPFCIGHAVPRVKRS